MAPLTLELDPGPGLRLRFAPPALGTGYQGNTPHPASAQDIKLSALLQRIGNACCHSHALHAAMIVPHQSLAHLEAPGQTLSMPDYQVDAPTILALMDDPTLLNFADSSAYLRQFLLRHSGDGLPTPHPPPQPPPPR